MRRVRQAPQDSTYFQRGLGLKKEVQSQLNEEYSSRVVDYLRRHEFVLALGDLSVHLAHEFGFCYGVDRAVEYAYQTCKRFPQRRIFLIGEIIHNPHVNNRLKDMGVEFLNGNQREEEKFARLHSGDVVIIPAFGVPITDFQRLREIGCILVNTTCGSVLNVWKNVEKYAREGFTSIVHGKHSHEETKATTSRTRLYPDGHYLVVRNLDETRGVCRYIVNGGDPKRFLARFAKVCSPGFDPDRHLQRIGLANQTTMLSSESLAIADKLEEAMVQRYGREHLAEHFRSFDTICSATQDRQDAILNLARNHAPTLVLVIGGYNSSNTNHLVEIASAYTRAYHIDDAACIQSAERLYHKPIGATEVVVATDWLPSGTITVGITAGASTPNSKIGEVIERLFTIRGYDITRVVTEQWPQQ